MSYDVPDEVFDRTGIGRTPPLRGETKVDYLLRLASLEMAKATARAPRAAPVHRPAAKSSPERRRRRRATRDARRRNRAG